MTLSDIYRAIQTKVNTLTGQTYVLTRNPQQNFSEGTSGVYRYLQPTGVSKERRSQGAPETIVQVKVGILQVSGKEADISSAEDEIDSMLNAILRSAQVGDNLIVYASQTAPVGEHYLDADGLDAEVPVLEATATIAIRAYYV